MKTSVSHRRGVMIGALALVLLASGSLAQPKPAPDMALGNPKARVTVVEYASLGCPHCAAWANEVFPAFRAKYINTGKVRFVLREMITGEPDLAAAGFLTARCAGPRKYFQIVDAIFAAQRQILDGKTSLLDIGKAAGLTEPQLKACLEDQVAVAALEARSQRAGQVDGIEGTPAYVINGKTYLNEMSLAQLDAAIAAARRR